MIAANSPIARRWLESVGAARGQRLAIWQEALDAEQGNISRAGDSIGVSKGRAMNLTREFGLNDYARELRYAAGYSAHTGRPPAGC